MDGWKLEDDLGHWGWMAYFSGGEVLLVSGRCKLLVFTGVWVFCAKWVFPKIGGFPPKWMIYFMKAPMNKWMIWVVVKTPIFGSTHLSDSIRDRFSSRKGWVVGHLKPTTFEFGSKGGRF